jgi:hypothetical protein
MVAAEVGVASVAMAMIWQWPSRIGNEIEDEQSVQESGETRERGRKARRVLYTKSFGSNPVHFGRYLARVSPEYLHGRISVQTRYGMSIA